MPFDPRDLALKEKFVSLRAYLAGLNRFDVYLERHPDAVSSRKKKVDLIERTLEKFSDDSLLSDLKNVIKSPDRLKDLGLSKKDVENMRYFLSGFCHALKKLHKIEQLELKAYQKKDPVMLFKAAKAEEKLRDHVVKQAKKSGFWSKLNRRVGTIAAVFLLAVSMGCTSMGAKATSEPLPQQDEVAITLEGSYRAPDLRVTKQGDSYYIIGRGSDRTTAEVNAKGELLRKMDATDATLSGFRLLKVRKADGKTYVLCRIPAKGIQVNR